MPHAYLQPGQFTGVRGHLARARDWMAAGVSGIEYREIVADGQWDSWLVDKELQYGVGFDTYNCTAFATLNAIEIQQLQQTGLLANYSDRYVGGLDGLSDIGNFAVAPPDAIRLFGLVPETHWPWPRLDPAFTRADYLLRPPDAVIADGKKWLDAWALNYEYVNPTPADLMKHLKQAPLNVISKVCPGWGTADIVAGCGLGNGHEYTLYGFMDGQYWKVYDHYDKEKKKLAWDYQFSFVIKNLLTPRTMPTLTPEAQAYLQMHDKKLVLATPSGRNAYIKNMVAREIITTDRGALAALAVLRENSFGGGVPDALYDQFPKLPF